MKNNWLLKSYLALVLAAGMAVSVYAGATYGWQLRLDGPFWLLMAGSLFLCLSGIIVNRESTMMLFISILVFAMTNQPILNVYCLLIVSFLATKLLSMTFRSEVLSGEWLDVKFFFNLAVLGLLTGISYGWAQTLPQTICARSVLILAGLCTVLCAGNFLLIGMAISLSSSRNAFKAMAGTLLKNTMLETFSAVIWYMLAIAYGSLGFAVFAVFIALVGGAVGNGIGARQLNRRLITDSLTEAYNRSFFCETIQEYLLAGRAFTLLFLDINDFKRINDTHGHLIGDTVLVAFTREIKRHLRREDMLFRYAGDEFCVIFPTRPKAESFAGRLNGLDPIRCSVQGLTIDCHFSLGYIDYDASQKLTFEQLVAAADRKMYRDKNTRKAGQMMPVTPAQ